MRPPIATMFHDTVNLCFDKALEAMGGPVGDVIYDYLEKRGISRPDIAMRFDDVVRLLTDTFGGSARIIIYRTVVEVHREYSLRADFTYQDSLRERMAFLQDRVFEDHLCPRHMQKADSYFDMPKSVPLISAMAHAR